MGQIKDPSKNMIIENENTDSLNGADPADGETDIEETPMETEDVNALKEKVTDLSDKNRKLFERAKKAEGFERKDGQWVKTQKPESKETPPPPKSQSNESDYSERMDKLTLKADGITHPDDQKIVTDEAKRLSLPVEEVAGMEHIKAKITANKDQRTAIAGMPKGGGKAGGNTQQDVEYWIAKGELPDSQELAEKVIEAKIAKEKSSQKQFSDEMHV